jgi:hypothetical protein
VIVDDSEEFAASVSRLLGSQGLEMVGFAACAPTTRVVLISNYGLDDLGGLIRRSPAAGSCPKTELGAAAIRVASSMRCVSGGRCRMSRLHRRRRAPGQL